MLYNCYRLSPYVFHVSQGIAQYLPKAPLSWGIARLCWKHAACIATQIAVSFYRAIGVSQLYCCKSRFKMTLTKPAEVYMNIWKTISIFGHPSHQPSRPGAREKMFMFIGPRPPCWETPHHPSSHRTKMFMFVCLSFPTKGFSDSLIRSLGC